MRRNAAPDTVPRPPPTATGSHGRRGYVSGGVVAASLVPFHPVPQRALLRRRISCGLRTLVLAADAAAPPLEKVPNLLCGDFIAGHSVVPFAGRCAQKGVAQC